MEATTKDLRLHTKSLIAATDRGEEVTITYRGKPRARLVPLSEPTVLRDPAAAYEAEPPNPAFGLWREGSADRLNQSVDDQVRRLRASRFGPKEET